MLAGIALGGGFDKFQEFAQALSLSGFHLCKSDTNAEGRIALGDNAVKDDAFHPDFAIGYPQTHFYRDTARDGSGSFHK